MPNTFCRKRLRQSVGLFVLACSVTLLGLPGATQAAKAGVWQTPLTFWLVDGYQFGEEVEWNPSRPYHLGEDAHGDPGTPVYAAANGTVMLAVDMNGGGWGGLVLIQHTNQAGDKVVSLHGHLDFDSIQVQDNQPISRGQLIGYLGDETKNGGWIPHLHFGVRAGRYIDAYAGEDWVYYGYGTADELADWYNPSDYIESHKDVVEVLRVPENSPNRYSTAVGVSQRRFPKKGSATQAFLASGTTFADALAAASLTGKDKAPLLLATKNILPDETAAELTRALAKDGQVKIIGGAEVIGPEVEEAIQNLGFKTVRIAGTSREGTAAKIASFLKTSRSVFIVNRDAFPDAVSAGGPANKQQIPLLFTDTDSLNDITQRYLENHPQIDTAYMIGGSSVISKQVEQELRGLSTLKTVTRLAGEQRYSTNLAVIKEFTPKPETLVLATGENYPDALTGSSLVGDEKGSLILVEPTGYKPDTKTYIDGTRPALDTALLLGGPAAIDKQLDTQLAEALNAPLTLASAPAEHDTLMASVQTETPQLSIRSDVSVQLAGVSVPAIDGYTVHEKTFNGGVVASLESFDESTELAPPISVTRIPMEGRDAEQVLATWFGVPVGYIQNHQNTNEDGRVTLENMPTLVKSDMFFVLEDNELVLTELRLPESQRELVNQEFLRSIPN